MRWERRTALADRLRMSEGAVRLFATTPPPAHRPATALQEAAWEFAETIRPVSPDGLVVYDLQDERTRNPAPRPFPFVPRHAASPYARILSRVSAHDVICFKSIGGMNVGGWRHWLDRTALEGDIRLLAPVGPPTSPAPPGAVGIARAIQLTAEHPAGFGAGSVLIAERNGTENAELRRLLAKQAAGCGWFISQTVYDAPRTIGLLRLYGRECRRLGIRPRRIVLSFAPCGGPRTLAFMHWLGIAVPAGIRAMLGSSSTPLTDSIEVCRSSLCQVLDSVGDLPLGFCVESLSSRQAEFEASIDLFAALGDVLWQHGHRRSSTAISALASA